MPCHDQNIFNSSAKIGDLPLERFFLRKNKGVPCRLRHDQTTIKTYILGGVQDCKTLWFPLESIFLAIIFECNMTTWSCKWGFSRYPPFFHSWHFFSCSDNFIRSWAMAPTSKRSKIRAEKGVLRYLTFRPINLRKALLELVLLWLLAQDRLALKVSFLELLQQSDADWVETEHEFNAFSLLLKWLFTWRSNRLCNSKGFVYNLSWSALFLFWALPCRATFGVVFV